MIDVADCPICGKRTDKVLTRVLRRGTGIVFHCERCDLGFLVASPKDAKAYYGKDYREQVSHRAAGGPTTPQELFETYRRYQDGRLAFVQPYLTPSTSILEIGASAGQFLHHVMAARRCAIEPDAGCCAFMEGMGIETDNSFLIDSRFYRERFDIVCAFQTLEHVDYPIQFFKDVRVVLKPGGVAFIEVPNLHEPLLSVWDIPEYVQFYFHEDHLFYFTAVSLAAIARSAGFKQQKLFFTQDYNLLSHLHFIMNGAPQPTCHIGLGPVKLKGRDPGMAAWLSNKLTALNEEYISMLQSTGETSNLLLILTN
jgi:SAM-dependent methyltransferase